MQRSRRSNPYPLTWEIPAALVVGVVLLLVLGLQAGRSVANLVAGGGWVFVDRADLFATLAGVLGGDAAAGLPSVPQPAGPGLLWTCIAVAETVVVAALGAVIRLGLRRWGAGRWHGMATSSDVEALLGRSRLRRHATVIRPDLYGEPRRSGT